MKTEGFRLSATRPAVLDSAGRDSLAESRESSRPIAWHGFSTRASSLKAHGWKCAGVSLLFFCLVGCAQDNKQGAALHAPPVRYVLGSPVDPALPKPATGVPLRLTAEGMSAAKPPKVDGVPIGSLSALILDSNSEPIAIAPPAAEAIMLFRDVSPVKWPSANPGKGGSSKSVAQGTLNTVLPAGSTITLSLAPPMPPTNTSPLELSIVSPTAAGIDKPRLILSAIRKDSIGVDEGAGKATDPGRMQAIVMNWPLDQPTGEFGLLVAPSKVLGLKQTTLWRINLSPVAPDDQASTAAADEIVKTLSVAPPVPLTRGAMLSAAINAAGTTDHEAIRRTLLSVSNEFNSELTAEAALLADEACIAPMAQGISTALGSAPANASNELLAWICDSAVLSQLAQFQAGGTLPTTLTAMLSARFGEAGRDATNLSDLAKASTNRLDFFTRIRAENLILLDDASISSRIRAFDWMQRNAIAPPGYDPMAAPAKRRAAIDAYVQSLSPPSPEGETAAPNSRQP